MRPDLFKLPLIDWQQLVLNLRRHQSLSQVGRELNMDAAMLRRLARGETSEPRLSEALQLLNLHLDLCPERHPALLNPIQTRKLK